MRISKNLISRTTAATDSDRQGSAKYSVGRRAPWVPGATCGLLLLNAAPGSAAAALQPGRPSKRLRVVPGQWGAGRLNKRHVGRYPSRRALAERPAILAPWTCAGGRHRGRGWKKLSHRT